jgi:hypothetical protein
MAFVVVTKHFKRKAYALALLLLFSLCPHQSLAVNHSDATSDIQDVIATHHFIWIGELFTDGTDKLLCVETEGRAYGLWNPLSDHLSATIPEEQMKTAPISDKCAHRGLHGSANNQELNNMMVNRLPIGGVRDGRHVNFSGGATLSLNLDGYSARCDLSLASYFTLTQQDGTTYSFYIVVRFKHPQLYVADECDDSGDEKQELMQEFDSISQLFSVDLGDGRTLLYSFANRNTRYERGPVILIVRAIPHAVWSSDDTVFIIPKDLLRPLLLKDGWKIRDLPTRYNALLKAIGKSPLRPTDEVKTTD